MANTKVNFVASPIVEIELKTAIYAAGADHRAAIMALL